MNKNKKQTFEELLFQTMKESGLLFPESDEEIEKFEARFTKHQLPQRLQDPDELLSRNREKITIEQCLDEFFKELSFQPAPWKYDDQPTYCNARIVGKGGNFVAQVWSGKKPSHEKVVANSKLIAHAPVMLRTICRTYLTLLIKFAYGQNDFCTSARISLQTTLALLRNDISNATGLECRYIQDKFESYAAGVHV